MIPECSPQAFKYYCNTHESRRELVLFPPRILLLPMSRIAISDGCGGEAEKDTHA